MVAERYRGAPRLNMNPETGESLCISCNLCALACPENLIVVGWVRDDATRRKVLTTFTYDTSRCMFCGLCEDACPTEGLELTQDFEMACYSREGAIWDRHRLEAGPTPTHYTRYQTWKFAKIRSRAVGWYPVNGKNCQRRKLRARLTREFGESQNTPDLSERRPLAGARYPHFDPLYRVEGEPGRTAEGIYDQMGPWALTRSSSKRRST